MEGGDEQDVGTVYGALHSCLSKVPRDLQRRVAHIAVCGQMHGAVCWAAGRAWTRNSRAQLEVPVKLICQEALYCVEVCGGEKVSPLYTWQDGRCSPEFLAGLPPPRSHLPLSSGYGNPDLPDTAALHCCRLRHHTVAAATSARGGGALGSLRHRHGLHSQRDPGDGCCDHLQPKCGQFRLLRLSVR